MLDKTYCDESLAKEVQKKNSHLFTPEKGERNTPQVIQQIDFAFKNNLTRQ